MPNSSVPSDPADPQNGRQRPPLKLPRKLEADSRHAELEALLSKQPLPLWEKSAFSVAHVPFRPALGKALANALNYQQMERGLEQIAQTLDREERGLAALRERQGTPPARRVSRLLLVANDGSERFYRECERILARHGDRVLCLWIEASSETLGHGLFGPEKAVKALLISDKDGVSSVLLSLLGA